MMMEKAASLLFVSTLIAGVLAVTIVPKLDEAEQRQENAATLHTVTPAIPPETQYEPTQFANAAILKKATDGQFWARADVDGTSVKFLIDTGASTVALTFNDAQRIGLNPETLDYKWSIRTAGGETKGASVLLNRIKISNVEVENVEAMVLRGGLDQSLLGMSFLGELYSYEFKQRTLIIRR